MEVPPKFKIKIISTFKDPLTRQIAESVRIDRRGVEILNSKSEYSRCRIPRLKINLDEWKKKEKPGRSGDTPLEVGSRLDTTPPGVPVKRALDGGDKPELGIKVTPTRDIAAEEERNRLEDEARRLEKKRRKGTSGGKNSKKRKLEKLTNWGEPTEEVKKDMFVIERVVECDKAIVKDDMRSVVEDEILKATTKTVSKTKMKISDEVRRTKFKYNTKGKLQKKEVTEIKRTHLNIFDWVKKKESVTIMKALETTDDEGRELVEILEREERLARMEKRRQTWETTFL